MTKYVVSSGGLANNPEKAKEYIDEMVKGFGDQPKVLFCFFGEPREDWEEKFAKYTGSFKTWLQEGVTAKFELAFPQTFVEQIKRFDVLYFHGRDDHLLQYWLSSLTYRIFGKVKR